MSQRGNHGAHTHTFIFKAKSSTVNFLCTPRRDAFDGLLMDGCVFIVYFLRVHKSAHACAAFYVPVLWAFGEDPFLEKCSHYFAAGAFAGRLTHHWLQSSCVAN